MSGRIELVIPGDTNELSPNARLHWQSRRRKVKQWRDKARIIYRYHGQVAFHGQVEISFIIRRGRRIDGDNARSSGALKAVIDGFVDEGMVKDDSTEFVLHGGVKQETGAGWRYAPELVVMVEACDGHD
jgi:hypothetical protein